MKFLATFTMLTCLVLIMVSILLGFNYPSPTNALHPALAGIMGGAAAIVGYAAAIVVGQD